MANYDILTSDALTAELYAKKLFEEAMKETFFDKFKGSIVDERTDFTKSQGDSFVYGLASRLSGSGKQNAETLVGNEEDITTYSDTVVVNLERHAVSYDNKITKQRAAFDVPQLAENLIKTWLAEKVDQVQWDAITNASNTLTLHHISGAVELEDSRTAASTSVAADSTSTLTPDFLMKIRPILKTGGNRARPPIKGVKIGGREYYVVVQHPDALVDLKLNSTYAQYVREAERRGPENPIFTGAVAIIDGFVIHESEFIDNTTEARVSRGVVLGKEAIMLMWASMPKVFLSDDNSDHGRKQAVVAEMIVGATATEFNSLPYGYMDMFCYAGDYSTLSTT